MEKPLPSQSMDITAASSKALEKKQQENNPQIEVMRARLLLQGCYICICLHYKALILKKAQVSKS